MNVRRRSLDLLEGRKMVGYSRFEKEWRICEDRRSRQIERFDTRESETVGAGALSICVHSLSAGTSTRP